MEILVWLVVGLILFCVIISKLTGLMASRGNALTESLAKHGMTLDYNYQDVLGIDSKSGKAFIYTDAGRILLPGDVRSIEKSSLHETKYNVYGMGFHKDKECKLILNTNSLDQPMHVIGFLNKNDMDLWYSRLCVFFNLS